MLLQNITMMAQMPLRRSGATAVNTENGKMFSCFGPVGPAAFTRFGRFPITDGYPIGYNPGIMMPLVHQDISSRQEAEVSIGSTGTGTLGRPIDGTGEVAIDSTATGELIMSGSGTGAIAIDSTGEVEAVILGDGTGAISVDSTGEASGLGWVAGTAEVSIDGTAESYAIGHMEGTTEDTTSLTPTTIKNAVWDALEDEHTDPGSMAERVKKALTRLQFLSLK